LNSWKDSEGLAFALLVSAILYGDLFLGVTIPMAVLILPVVVLLRMPRLLREWPRLPNGFFFLGLTGIAVALQTVFGYGPRGKTDLVVYLPLVYSGLTMIVMSGSRVPDRHVHVTFVAAGVLSGVMLAATLMWGDRESYAVPGQNPVVAQQREEDVRTVVRPGAGVVAPAEPAVVHETPARAAYYEFKNRVRSPLGKSNYLAVVFVFLFNVMVYQRSWWSLLFAGLVLLTVSRSGMAFLLMSVFFWIAHMRGWLRAAIVGAGSAALAASVVILGVGDQYLRTIAGLETVVARLWFQRAAFEPIAVHPLIGAPRSEVIREFAYPLSWHPHNSILHLLVLFGVLGTIGYLAYAGLVLKAAAIHARQSRVWSGITAGVAITLLWSLVEIVDLTPAFELLMAGIYCAARGRSPDIETSVRYVK
jgi:hypothetical protein